MKTLIASTDPVQRALDFFDTVFADHPLTRVGFELWDGTRWPDDQPRAATLVLKHPDALRAMFGGGDEKSLAEAYVRDDFDVRGEIEAALELADHMAERRHGDWFQAIRGYYQLRRIGVPARHRRPWRMLREVGAPLHSPARDRQAVSFHYDLSNDFFQLWLDERMQYSCAYFENPDDPLGVAQTAKLRLLCRKLRLRPGQRVLDIGCGWGGFGIHAAQHHGVQVTGVTLSEKQASLATTRVRAAGLSGDVTMELRDYRELPDEPAYDAIVSIGMSEHVGRRNLPDYFAKAARMLKPGGVFLNHAISEGVRPRGDRGPSFIEEHVFPDSDIPALPIVLAAAESAGLEVRDVENLREHYRRTLRHWVARLEAGHDEARSLVDEGTYRVWRLFMAGSAHGFRTGQLAIYQALLAKPDAGGDARLPLTRRDWYG
jgi:cyclopropane-fatty-acyl-phospholipid synthase